MTRTCVGACGFMSRKATVVSVCRTIVAGISPVTILQNRQSACGSPAITAHLSGDTTFWYGRADERTGPNGGPERTGTEAAPPWHRHPLDPTPSPPDAIGPPVAAVAARCWPAAPPARPAPAPPPCPVADRARPPSPAGPGPPPRPGRRRGSRQI